MPCFLLYDGYFELAGKEPGMPQFGRADGDMSDDRIQHILTEASSMIKGPSQQQQQQQQAQQQMHHSMHHSQSSQHQQHYLNQEDTHSNEDSKSPLNNCTSPFSSRDYLSKKMKKYENDDIPQDKISKIYQEEFSKLMTRAPRDAFPRYVKKYQLNHSTKSAYSVGVGEQTARIKLVFFFHTFSVVACHQ